ncbi:hypothetical protein ACFXKI_32385 [Streptomyces mirabilis]|uniref:hypothetical protein n=1 Tax=Streptomyces mirabilis TaxID=68239 RepID=UPI00368A6931
MALEELVRQKERLELPAFSTLDRMASRIRSEVEASQCEAIVARMSDVARERVAGMLEVAEGEYQSLFAWIKQPAQRATGSRSAPSRSWSTGTRSPPEPPPQVSHGSTTTLATGSALHLLRTVPAPHGLRSLRLLHAQDL